MQAATGIGHLHSNNILHKDVKPANVLLKHQLQEPGGQKRVVAKITDFGISRLMLPEEQNYVSAQLRGTPAYLDPQYMTSYIYTKASDVYSFGLVIL